MNGWWLKLFTDPYAEVDGIVRRCSWHAATEVEVEAGPHRLRTFVRYRKLVRGDGGASERTIDVPPEGGLTIRVSNGMPNNSPFVARVIG